MLAFEKFSIPQHNDTRKSVARKRFLQKQIVLVIDESKANMVIISIKVVEDLNSFRYLAVGVQTRHWELFRNANHPGCF